MDFWDYYIILYLYIIEELVILMELWVRGKPKFFISFP